MTRSYHNINAKYNGFFNAREEYKKGVIKVENAHKDNYRELLPLFIVGDKEIAKSVATEMDVTIKKSSRVIQFHSMNIKGKEYCKWIDDTWMLIGKAYFYEKNWAECRPIFEYVSKKFKKSGLKIEARIWLVRTLLEQENYDRADVVLQTLRNNNNLPEEYLPLYKAVSAQYFIANEEYSKAIIDLEEATLLEKDKEKLTRWLFVLAQLYAIEGESIRANNTYKLVVKKHPEYEMEFWAQMHRAFSYQSSNGSSYAIKKTLLKMLRDDKNKEYRDKLYYALSKIYKQEDREDKQIRALKLSAKVSTEDDYQKGQSFLTLGQIYFSKPEYKPAQANYDSAVAYLPKDFPGLKQIVNIQTSLKDLVDQIVIIETQDSLLKLGSLPEAERLAFIEDVIDEKLAEEERKREELEGDGSTTTSTERLGFDDGSNKGKWYFYNERNIKLGAQEFKSIWGSRANEDNWRRSDKTVVSEDDLFAENSSENDSTMNDIKNMAKYLRDIPVTPKARAAANDIMSEAYYKLGTIYKENMNDDERAIGTFRMLVSRFDTSKHHITSYFLLYRMYLNENKIDSSNYFKNQVLYRYPNSDYAKIIRDPSYAQQMSGEKKAISVYYKKAYYYYDRGFFDACIEKVDACEKKYPQNYLSNKLQYLKALSQGSKGGKEELVASLRKYVAAHDGTPEAKDAKNRIKILTTKKIIAKKKEAPKYVFERNSRHLALLLVPINGNDIEEIKKSISNYNRAYQVGKNLKISSVLLDKNTHMISIKQFQNEEKAKEYYLAFLSNHTSLKKVNASNFDLLIISYTNYAIFFQDKSIENYQDFMKTNYQL